MLVIEKLRRQHHRGDQGGRQAMEALKPGLPADRGLVLFDRPVRAGGIDNVTMALLVGALLLLLALAAFLFDWRSALVSFAAIVCSLAAAVSVFYLRAVTVNAMCSRPRGRPRGRHRRRGGRAHRGPPPARESTDEGFKPSAALLEASGTCAAGLRTPG